MLNDLTIVRKKLQSAQYESIGFREFYLVSENYIPGAMPDYHYLNVSRDSAFHERVVVTSSTHLYGL